MKPRKSCVKIQGTLLGKTLSWLVICLLALSLWASPANAQVPGIIFDSDMSSDHDDVADLALLNALANLGECTILACMTDSTNGGSPLCMNAINTYYGHPNVPCGIRPDSGGAGGYAGTISSEFPHPLYSNYTQCPLAVNLYRQILASQPDHSVIIVTTGYLNNLAALLQSGPDQYSSLSGSALVAQKVKLLSCTGGQYPSGGEFNFTVEPTAAQYTINNWPAPATYTGFELGGLIVSGGALQATPLSNPVRRAWELTFWGAYPTWGQQGIYLAVRGAESATLWDMVNVGYNTVAANGVNTWVSSGTPNQYNQAYLLDKVRYPLQEAIRSLVTAPPPSVSAVPTQPSNVRVTISGGNAINLQWTDNSYSETGFKIERGVNGVYTQVAAVGANVTSYSDTGLSSTANVSYRVRATNTMGDSLYSYIWVYSGWTETNFSNAANVPLYSYYQTCDLKGLAGSANNHVTVNNDSTHGQNLTVNVDVSGSNGAAYYIYFFYQNASNWYRLSVSGSISKFEKSVGGTITQIGSSGAGVGTGERLQHWRLLVTQAGNLQFLTDWSSGENVSPTFATILNVSDTLSFTAGKVGLGAQGGSPTWQNINFNTLTGVPAVPTSPTGVSATPGSGQVALSWTAVAGATSYNIYQARGADGEGSTPLASGLTSPSYTHTGLTNGTPSYYKVAAVNSTGLSSYSYEVSATPGTAITTYFPNGTYEITPQSTGMALTITGSTTTPSVVQQPYSNAANQKWTLTNLGNNVVSLVCAGNGLALEAPGASPVNGAYLGTGTYSGASHQIWQIVPSGITGYYEIINLNSSLSLNVAFGSSQAGIGIVQYAVSNASNSIWAFTSTSGGGVPAAPAGLAATAGNTQVNLSWTASSGAATYEVYRGTSSNGQNSSPVATGITGTTYTNTSLVNGTTYYYKVKGVNATGSSSYSNEASAVPAQPSATAQVIWPLGDSITNGYNVQAGDAAGGGYRTQLYNRMVSAGTPFSYVGSYAINPSATLTTAGSAYTSHDGHNGYGVTNIDDNLTANPNADSNNGGYWITGGNGTGRSAINPSIVLVNIGTNNFSTGASASSVYAQLSTLLNHLKTALPNAQIFVSSLTPRTDAAAENLEQQYSALISSGISSFGSNFHFVDLHTNFPVNGLGPDGLHPNLVGYNWMGDRWADAVAAYLNSSPVPIITSPVSVSGIVGSSFNYQITASSNPTSFNATGLPNGLTVNTGTGAITGTLNATGSSNVTLSATNGNGTGNANLVLTVNPAGSAPNAPTNLAAATGNAQVSLSWTASSGAASYNVYRGTSAGAESSTAVATNLTTVNYTNTGLTNGTTYYFVVKAVNASGTSSASNEVSSTPSASSTTFANASFETPAIGGFSYGPSGSGWTFTNNGGIQHNGSAYSYSTTIAPDGTQTAFLQGASTLSSMSQSVNFVTAGSYTIAFQAARRGGSVQPIQVSVDGSAVGTYTPSGDSFAQITTASFTVTAGNHTVMFAATDSTGDKTAFIDLVSISGGGSAPAAPSGLTGTAGNMQAILSWTASSGATSYNVYRGTTAGGESNTPVATNLTNPTYTNTGLINGTTYYYRVRAVNAIGSSGDSNEASVLVNQSYGNWTVENNLSGNNALPTADPNSNGVSNLVEYALGMDPASGSLTGLPTSFVDGTNLSISYNQLRVDVTYQPEWSTDLATWHTENINISAVGTVKTATIPLGTDSRKFIRLRIVQ